ncbi:hypothetical protein CHCC20497_2074 [Bacillus paralicheniformis]|nr:hypothetical protein BSSX_p0053 [Bacillus subtilis]TWJ82604.1 hypothetical protein CHCC20497_2074 [Bacillus paralicheniformis]
MLVYIARKEFFIFTFSFINKAALLLYYMQRRAEPFILEALKEEKDNEIHF